MPKKTRQQMQMSLFGAEIQKVEPKLKTNPMPAWNREPLRFLEPRCYCGGRYKLASIRQFDGQPWMELECMDNEYHNKKHLAALNGGMHRRKAA